MPILANFSFANTSANGGSVDSIEIDSFSFGVSNTTTLGSSTGGGAGKATFNEITVTKRTDVAASPLLLAACDGGELLPAVQLSFIHDNAKTPYLTYNLQTVLVSAVQWSSGGDRPTESLSFAFEELVVTYVDEQTGTTSTNKIKTDGRFFYP